MAIPVELVKELRERTGAGIKECRDILTETNGDMDAAIAILRERGIEAAAKKQEREVGDGRIEIYVHPGSRLAAMIEVNCETDFVARTEDFISLTRDLALHVAAVNPLYLQASDVPEAAIAESGMTPQKYYEQYVLMAQPYVKDATMTIEDKVKDGIARLGENIVIRRFARFEVGS